MKNEKVLLLLFVGFLLAACEGKESATSQDPGCSAVASGNGSQASCAIGGDATNQSAAKPEIMAASAEQDKCCDDLCLGRGNVPGSEGLHSCALECIEKGQCDLAGNPVPEPTPEPFPLIP